MKPFLLTLLFAIAAIQNPTAPGTGTIEGRVLRAGSGEPAANMPITLIESSGISEEAAGAMLEQISTLVTIGLQSASQIPTNAAITNLIRSAGPGVSEPVSILTDRAGHFEFPNLRKGRYTVWVQRQGYFGPSFNGVPASVSARTIAFDPAQPSPVDVVVIQSATITGRVLDSRGRPVSGANVRAFRPTYDEGRVVWETVANSQPTDDVGEYRIPWLPPGDYYLAAQVANSVRTFYPGTTQAAEARKLTVDSGETRGIDINVQSGPNAFAKISGFAINPNSATADRSFPSFVLIPRDFSPLSNEVVTFPNLISADQRQNGEFELRNVPPGIYDLFPTTVVAGFVAGRTFVNVRNSDAEGVRVNVNSAVNLPGTVVLNGPAAQSIAITSIQIGLKGFSMPIRGNLPGNGPRNAAFPVDASGKFTATGLSGEKASVQVTGLPETAYVADIRQGDLSVYDSGVELNGSMEPLRVLVESQGGSLEGTVRNKQRQPESRVTVVLVPPAERRQNPALYRTRVTNDAGHFEMRGIPPGTYTVFAWKSVLPTAWMNAEFLATYLDRGQVINITSASPSNLELESIP
jgi:hypothetical protein